MEHFLVNAGQIACMFLESALGIFWNFVGWWDYLSKRIRGKVNLYNWDSLHVRLNSHYKAWTFKKKKHKKIEHTGKHSQRKAFYRQGIPETSCAWKETVDIDIFVTSSNGDRKIMQSIRIKRFWFCCIFCETIWN